MDGEFNVAMLFAGVVGCGLTRADSGSDVVLLVDVDVNIRHSSASTSEVLISIMSLDLNPLAPPICLLAVFLVERDGS